MNKKSKADTVASVGILAALAVALSFLEGLIPPLPMMPPGAKLGFSNIVVMFSAGVCGAVPTLLTVLVKSGFVLLTGGVTAGFLSLLGGVLSASVMLMLMKNKKISLFAVGILSAISHNIGQLIGTLILFRSLSVLYYTPFLIVFGIVFGGLTGTLFKITFPAIKKISRISN